MLRNSMCISPCGMSSYCSPPSIPIRVMWQLEWDTSHIRSGLEYLKRCLIGDRSGDMDGQSSVDMTGFQTVFCHVAGMGLGSLAGR